MTAGRCCNAEAEICSLVLRCFELGRCAQPAGDHVGSRPRRSAGPRNQVPASPPSAPRGVSTECYFSLSVRRRSCEPGQSRHVSVQNRKAKAPDQGELRRLREMRSVASLAARVTAAAPSPHNTPTAMPTITPTTMMATSQMSWFGFNLRSRCGATSGVLLVQPCR